MKTIATLILCAGSLAAECVGPVLHLAGNFAHDMSGQSDSRPHHWGTTDAFVWEWTPFYPPAGQRVRVLSVTGDLTARWTTRGKGRAWPGYGYYTGVLAALMLHPASWGDAVGLAADDQLIYVQGDIGASGVVRVPFAQRFDERSPLALLENETSLAERMARTEPWLIPPTGAKPHAIYVKVAKYLDETNLDTHVEVTIQNLEYCYDDGL